jgi:hypothetical protein
MKFFAIDGKYLVYRMLAQESSAASRNRFHYNKFHAKNLANVVVYLSVHGPRKWLRMSTNLHSSSCVRRLPGVTQVTFAATFTIYSATEGGAKKVL